ncbi:putative disease resistance protein RGA3 [Humulus lupulus]|uniref:putative disease resistance protein RGA3 n=1 Tax=Humulus lupulus TaxID=3486 RepID=UPI002B404DD4|nr:putative disease resistance protein RGA3 [Humulus lupulus]
MSQNYLGCGTNSKEECRECFDTLIMRSFFQNFEQRSNDDSITHCKMHDIVHDFLQFLTKDESVAIEVLDDIEENLEPLDDKGRHLTLVVGSDAQFPIVEYNKMNEKNLRTLFIVSNTNNCSIDTSLFSRLTCLRTLNLSKCGIQSLPKSIGKLIHLRYLNLESNPDLVELPLAICGLCNLQTLNLDYCTALGKLPDGMAKLINLKHLYIKSCFMLEGLPRGTVCLVSLERLNMLVIPKDRGSYFDIGDLNRLNKLQLRGSLHIKECRNIKNVDEIEQIHLKNSEDIVSFSLDFGWLEKLENDFEDDITILEALEPHQNLMELIISNYMGPNLSPRPKWLMPLIHLRKLALLFREKCEIIPSFGGLPSLEVLQLAGMKNVKNVGLEFLGITEKRDQDDDATLNNPLVMFPKLKRLVFINMEQLEKWEGRETPAAETSLVVMPRLKRLELEGCPRLLALPDFLQTTTSLKYLSISKSEIVEEYCQRRTEKEWDKISNIPNITLNDKIVRKDGIWIQEDNINDVIGTSSTPK